MGGVGSQEPAFSNDSARLLVRSSGGLCTLWDTHAGTRITLRDVDGAQLSDLDKVQDYEFSADGTRAVVRSDDADGSADEEGILWDARQGKKVAHLGKISKFRFSPDSKWLLVWTPDYSVWLWDARMGKRGVNSENFWVCLNFPATAHGWQ